MTILYSPANLELLEFAGTAGTTVTLTDDSIPIPATIEIYNVTTTPNIGLNISHTNTSFTFSGTFPYMFPISISYVLQGDDRIKQYNSVTRFEDLPKSYKGIWKYDPPSTDLMEIKFNIFALINGTPTELTWILDLRHNSSVSMANLRASIKAGEGFKTAVTKYPELI